MVGLLIVTFVNLERTNIYSVIDSILSHFKTKLVNLEMSPVYASVRAFVFLSQPARAKLLG